MTECMKIRYYVMSLLYKNPGVSIKLASIRDLAAQFGVANSTVALVLNQLKKEKFLISRHGIGIFTVPDSASTWKHTKPVIGLIYGSGKHFFHGYDSWRILSKVGENLCKDGYSVRYVYLAGNTDEAILNELLNSYLAGLVLQSGNLKHRFHTSEGSRDHISWNKYAKKMLIRGVFRQNRS